MSSRTTPRLRSRIAAGALGLLLLPALAGAQEAAGGHGGGNPLTEFRPGLLIWTIVTFLLLVALLRWKAWPPIVDALRRREDAVREAIAEARRQREESEKVLAEQQRVLGEARREAAQLLARGREDAARARDQLIARAREESEKIIDAGRQAIEQEKRAAIQELRASAVDLALAASSKLLRARVDDARDRELVAAYVREMEGRSGGTPGA